MVKKCTGTCTNAKRCTGICKNGKRCKNSIYCRFHGLKQKFKGEKHMLMRDRTGRLVRGNYCGPNTNLKAREKLGLKPVNKVDSVCKKHDYAYARIGKANITKKAKKKQVRQADLAMIKSLKKIKGWESTFASLVIKGKIGLETIGIINRLKFIH